MSDVMYPEGVLGVKIEKASVQSYLFGHRIKPQQTCYEYLSEFLQVALAPKRIADTDNTNFCSDYFIVSEETARHAIEYRPISNMGLKRFVFFNNSRLDTKAAIDKKAYKQCVEILTSCMETDNMNSVEEKDLISILQNILYGFSIENAGRSWFNKNLLPICPEVLFPESLARKRLRSSADPGTYELDSKFDFNSYTYMARGGEVYYLHLLHAINYYDPHKKDLIERQLNRLLHSIPQLSEISSFIQQEWVKGMNFDESDMKKPVVKKTMGAIPLYYAYRDQHTLSEITNYLDNHIQPMEKINILSQGIVLQLFRLMTTTAAKNSNSAGSAWLIDVCDQNRREYDEIRKLSSRCFQMNEESILKYIDIGIEHYANECSDEEKNKKRNDAEKDTTKLIRKVGKSMGIIKPLNGPNMRFTLSEDIIKFLVMSLIPAGSKVTFDRFLDMLYDHFEMIISPVHYERAVTEGKIISHGNAAFLKTNQSDFAIKLKNCGLLRDLSDATAIVENPYESEESQN